MKLLHLWFIRHPCALIALVNLDLGYSGIAILFAVAAVVSVVFKKLKQPLILGYIIAGVLSAPFLASDSSIISLISDLGITLLAFTMGMELSLRGLRELGHRIILGGIAELAIMLPSGYIVATLFGWSRMTAVFFAAAFALTSTTIVMTTMRDSRERLRSYSDILIGLLVVEDLMTVVILALLSAVGAQHSIMPLQVLELIGGIVLFAAVSLILAISILPKAINKISDMGNDEILMIVSLGLCFALALFAQQLGFSFVIGAFIVGVAVAESEHKERIQQKMMPIRDVFLAVFFVSIGTLIQLSYVPALLPFAVGLGVLFVVWKLISVSIGFTTMGFTPKNAVFVGIAAGAMGEFSFVIGRLGLQYGYFTEQIYTLIVLISAVTIVILPQTLKRNDTIYDNLEKRMPSGMKVYSIAAKRFADSIRAQFSKPRKMKNSSRNLVFTLLLNGTVVIAILILTFLFVGNSRYLILKLGVEYGLLYLCYTCAIVLLLYASFNTVSNETKRFFIQKDQKVAFSTRLMFRMIQAVYAALCIAIVISTLEPILYYQPLIGLAAAAAVGVIVLVLWRGLSEMTLNIPSANKESKEVHTWADSDYIAELLKG